MGPDYGDPGGCVVCHGGTPTGTTVEDGEVGYDASAMLNLSLGDTAAFRLVGFSAYDAGYIDNVLGTSPRGTFDNAHRARWWGGG